MPRKLRIADLDQEPGEFYGTPKELFGFRWRGSGGRLKRSSRQQALTFLQTHAEILGLPRDLSSLRFQRQVTGLGATHALFQQFHQGVRVHRGYVTVHASHLGEVYLVKNRAMPVNMLPAQFDTRIGQSAVIRLARREVGEPDRPLRLVRLEQRWFPLADQLIPAWRVRLVRRVPREEWIVYVSAISGAILSKYDNVAEAKGTGLVFVPNPVVKVESYEQLLDSDKRPKRPPFTTYAKVSLLGLDGSGYLNGKRVSTSGMAQRDRIYRSNLDFRVASHQRGFEEVMVYYHLDTAIRYLESLGYRGKRAIFREPVITNPRASHQDNSWYSPTKKTLSFGTGAIDDAEDGETILHEFGHAIQDAIIPDFGQSEAGAAMGEGFGDYFAASFFASHKPPKYQPTVMSWDGLLWGIEDGSDPPALRRIDQRLTTNDFQEQGDEHDNGQIWSTLLWDIYQACGRDVADRLILDSHFEQDAFTNFARGARAILHADENLYQGTHSTKLRGIFRQRRVRIT